MEGSRGHGWGPRGQGWGWMRGGAEAGGSGIRPSNGGGELALKRVLHGKRGWPDSRAPSSLLPGSLPLPTWGRSVTPQALHLFGQLPPGVTQRQRRCTHPATRENQSGPAHSRVLKSASSRKEGKKRERPPAAQGMEGGGATVGQEARGLGWGQGTAAISSTYVEEVPARPAHPCHAVTSILR